MAPDSPAGFDHNPFMSFWSEWLNNMSASGMNMPSPSQETMELMQKTFLDVMAKQSDQFMRSEAFLGAMKQSMDNTLAWQKAFNEMLTKGLASAQIPSRADADHLVVLVRGLQDRVLKKLEQLQQRVEHLEELASRQSTTGK